MKTPITGIILAGGKSRRMGHDKRRMRLWGAEGPTLLDHTLTTIAPLCHEVIVALNDPDEWQHLAARLVRDEATDAGALGGLVAGLAAMRTPRALVVAADMPYLNVALLQAIIEWEHDGQVLVPRSPRTAHSRGGIEPLHAIYEAASLPMLREQLEQGERRLSFILESLRLTVLEPSVWMRYDAQGQSFINLNTPDDVHRLYHE